MKKNLSDSNRLTRVAAAVVLWILSFIVSKSPLKIIFRLLGTVLGVSGAVGFCPAKCLLGGDQCRLTSSRSTLFDAHWCCETAGYRGNRGPLQPK